jgi:hypothetical protein
MYWTFFIVNSFFCGCDLQVRQMADPSANPSTATESVDLSKTSNAQRQHRSASVSVRAFAGSQPNSAASRRIAAVFGPSQDFMLDSFQQLADQCLFAMRLEIAVHCLFFLQAMRDENYWLTDEPTTPEPFVLELNTSLTQAEERLSVCLPSDKIKYLFGTTAQMMGAIFVAALPAGTLSLFVLIHYVIMFLQSCFFMCSGWRTCESTRRRTSSAQFVSAAAEFDQHCRHARNVLRSRSSVCRAFIAERGGVAGSIS